MLILYWLTKPILGKKPITLVGERGDTFQDNSSYLFKFAREKGDSRYYFVLDPSAKDFEKVKKIGHVIKKNTWKHYLYLLHAKKVVNSYEVDSYFKPKGYSREQFYQFFGDLLNYKRIYLQHGITYNDVYYSLSRYVTGNDYIVVTNKFEKENFLKKAGYSPEQIICTGMPRFDGLLARKEKSSLKKLLIMPTWRSYLGINSFIGGQNKDILAAKFVKSDYFQFYNQLVKNEDFNDFLKKKQIEVTFYLHYEMAPFLSFFEKSPSIHFDNSSHIQSLLRSSDLLVTDYSSVFMDFLFMDKPIIFTQFDRNDFYQNHYKPGYVDFKKPYLGDVVTNHKQFMEALIKLEKQKFKSHVDDEKVRNEIFTYIKEGKNNIRLKLYQKINEI